MSSTPDPVPDDILRRLDLLERDNARLRSRLQPFIGADNPSFDFAALGKAMRFYTFVYVVPLFAVISAAIPLTMQYNRFIPRLEVLPGFPLIDPGGLFSGRPGIGFGVIALGGLAVGVLAIGGGAIGILAFGGGALGVIALGGGAVGVIALGGGSLGYIAVGGGAAGRYVLAGDGAGKYVISRKRQDPEAIALFTHYLPRLRKAFTGPMPVIPVQSQSG